MKEFQSFIAGITQKLSMPLPGITSQLKMATMKRLMKYGHVFIPADARKAGVLVLFYPNNGGINLVFIKRAEYPGVHSGQISFPGGSFEEGDKDIVATALRETEEEIGVYSHSVFTVGKLTDLFIPPSNFLVTPVIGYTLERPEFRPDPEEVDRIIEVPLDHLLDDKTRQEHDITIFPAVKIKAPCFYVDGNIIWGATAMMLNELMEVISQGT